MITIRPEKPQDIAAVRAINQAAFDEPAEANIVDLQIKLAHIGTAANKESGDVVPLYAELFKGESVTWRRALPVT